MIIDYIRVEFIAGTLIDDAIIQVWELTERMKAIVRFNFNGVELSTMDNPQEMQRIYNNKLHYEEYEEADK